MWVLTVSVNDYRQHGEYFAACWAHKPLMYEIRNALNNTAFRCVELNTAALVRDGEVADDDNYYRYYLRETKPDGTVTMPEYW